MKTIIKRQLVGRIFIETKLIPLASDNGSIAGYHHRVGAENIVRIPRDIRVHSACPDGNAISEPKPTNKWTHEFLALLSFHDGYDVPISPPADSSPVMRVHTNKLSAKDEVSAKWVDHLMEPVLELKTSN